MADLRLSFSVMPSLLTAPLVDGEVQPAGVSLDVHRPESVDKNSREMLDLAFDVAEMSVATFLKAVEEGVPLVGLPLFTSGRRFLQAYFHLSAQAGVRDLSELAGRTVGTPQYWISTVLWQRVILQEMHAVAPRDMTWVTWQPERMDALAVPTDVHLRRDTSGRTPAQLMEEGEIDAAFMATFPVPAGKEGMVEPGYPDRVAAERAYYQRTGIFPLMHMTAMQRDVAEREPAAVASLCDAYQRAKELAQSRTLPTQAASPKAGETTLDMLEIVGHDPWVYGVTPNKKVLDALLDAALDQGLLSRRLALDEIFAPLPETWT